MSNQILVLDFACMHAQSLKWCPLGWEDPWRRDGYPVQYSCLENPVDRGASGLQSIGSRDLDVTEHTYTK